MEKKVAILITVCVGIIVIVFFVFFVFITSTQQSNDHYSALCYGEFNKTPMSAYTYSFSPPVSMYHALLIALEGGGWNATSLENMAIGVELDYCAFLNSPNETGGGPLYPVTHSVADWSPKQSMTRLTDTSGRLSLEMRVSFGVFRLLDTIGLTPQRVN